MDLTFKIAFIPLGVMLFFLIMYILFRRDTLKLIYLISSLVSSLVWLSIAVYLVIQILLKP